MAPGKTNTKKKRAPAGGFAATTVAASHGATGVASGAAGGTSNGPVAAGGLSDASINSMPMTLDQAGRYYGHLLSESNQLRFHLGVSLWLQQIVAVAVLNALMYEQTVQVTQLVSAVLAVLWLGRQFLLEHTVRITPSFIQWRRFLAWRALLLVLFSVVTAAVHHFYIGKISRDCFTSLGVVATLDAISVINSVFSSRPNAALKLTHLVEIVFVAGVFSTQYNHQPFLIYDRAAISLVLGVCVAHYAVVEGIQNALFEAPWTSDEDIAYGQQQRWATVEEIHKLLDHGVDLKPAINRHKKKHTTTENDETGDSDPTRDPPRRRGETRGEVSRWLAVQVVVVLIQLIATAFGVYSWELCSVLMCTSVELLLKMTRVRWSLERACPLPATVDSVLGTAGAHPAHES